MAEIPAELAEVLGDVRIPGDLAKPMIQVWQMLTDEDRQAFCYLMRRIPDPLNRALFITTSSMFFLVGTDFQPTAPEPSKPPRVRWLPS